MGIMDKITGRLKKTAGTAVDDPSLREEGRTEEHKGEKEEEAARKQEEAREKQAEAERLENRS